MRTPSVLVLALLAAGCAQSDAPVAEGPAPLPGLQAYDACPEVRGQVHACEPSEDSPYVVDVRSEVPPGWSCLTFADARFETDVFGNGDYPYPDWYLYYGPVVGDGEARGTMGLGIRYDTHGDTEAVAGALMIASEDDPRVFVFEGAGAGFVQLPTPIRSREARLYGLLYPTAPTQGQHVHENDAAPPGFSWTSQPSVDHREFWSQGPLDPSQGYVASGERDLLQWNLVHNADLGGQARHLPAPRNGTVGFGPSDGSGTAHWGWARGSPFNTSVRADGLLVEASLQPYLEFYAEFHDLQDPSALATSRFLCGCPDPTVASWIADPVMGVQCLAGLPLPVMAQAASHGGQATVA